jgi:hypothetical protein
MSLQAWTSPGVVAAFLSAVAAIAAAVATWRAPLSAAKTAEHLRRQGDNELESRRFRLNVFTAIMQGRAEIWSEDTVTALNSVDVAFYSSIPVREAWAELYQALNTSPMPMHVVDERTRKLLREMAKDLGLADSLRLDDFGRVYFPNAIAEDRQMRNLQRREAMDRLTGQSATPDRGAVEAVEMKWPPVPGQGKPANGG